MEEIRSLLPNSGRARMVDAFFLVSRVWCMGFAWSSFVAQSTLLACCRASGLDDSLCLCDQRPSPLANVEAYAVATDDVMHFITLGADVSSSRMAALDDVLLSNGIEKHPAKGEDGVANGTCIGVDLCDGKLFTAEGAQAWSVNSCCS